MKIFLVFFLISLLFAFAIGLTRTPEQMNPSVELYNLQTSGTCSGLKGLSVFFPISDSPQTKNDVELESLMNMEQMIFFAQEENISIENPYFKSFLVNTKGEKKSCFIFCVDSSIAEEKLREIIEKAF